MADPRLEDAFQDADRALDELLGSGWDAFSGGLGELQCGVPAPVPRP